MSDPESWLVKKLERAGVRKIRFHEGEDPAVCAFRGKETRTVTEAIEEPGLEGRLYYDDDAIPFKMRIGKLEPNVIYVRP